MLKKVLIITLALAVSALAYIYITFPDVSKLKDKNRSLTISVKDWNGKDHSFVVGPKNPNWVFIQRIPKSLIGAVVVSEDSLFFRHKGLDYKAIKEALKKDIEEGKFVRGGSTITQQVAKNLYLTREKTISRKIKEIFVAKSLENNLPKRRILELYLNIVEQGPMVYGVGASSKFYFGKDISSINPAEAAFLASMLPGPKVYNPYRNLGRVLRRSRIILKRMAQGGFISASDYETYSVFDINIKGIENKIESASGLKIEKLPDSSEVEINESEEKEKLDKSHLDSTKPVD